MSGQVFAFKQFSINQDKCAMKVGTDAVLLGAWTSPGSASEILDIGTGTGVIALMLAQKSPAHIDALDIDKGACHQAEENITASPWANRVSVFHIPFQEFYPHSIKKYDLIVSNPPYFIDSSKASDLERTTARHADLLPFEDLIEGVKKLLTKNGKFCVILPSKEGQLFRDKAEAAQLFLNKLTRVRTRMDKTSEKRLLMQFGLSRKEFSENTIVIEKDERHSYTEEYKELTKDYYLNF